MDDRLTQIYRGHEIQVDAIKTTTGWSWRYLIDGHVASLRKIKLLPDAEAALRQGLAAAQARVDGMEGG